MRSVVSERVSLDEEPPVEVRSLARATWRAWHTMSDHTDTCDICKVAGQLAQHADHAPAFPPCANGLRLINRVVRALAVLLYHGVVLDGLQALYDGLKCEACGQTFAGLLVPCSGCGKTHRLCSACAVRARAAEQHP
jgi:hypothetical protein